MSDGSSLLTRAARQREPTATRTSDKEAWPPSGWTMSVAVAWRLSSWTVRHSRWALTTVDIVKTLACPVAPAKVQRITSTSVKMGHAAEGTLFISSQLFTDAVRPPPPPLPPPKSVGTNTIAAGIYRQCAHIVMRRVRPG